MLRDAIVIVVKITYSERARDLSDALVRCIEAARERAMRRAQIERAS